MLASVVVATLMLATVVLATVVLAIVVLATVVLATVTLATVVQGQDLPPQCKLLGAVFTNYAAVSTSFVLPSPGTISVLFGSS
jgi:hypothetical protein